MMNIYNCKLIKEYCIVNCFFGLVVKDDFIYVINWNENNVIIILSEMFIFWGKILINGNFVLYGIC